MKNLKHFLKKASKKHWAIGQFNFSDFSQVKGIIQAARELKSPVILGTSEREAEFIGLKQAVAIRDAWRKDTGLPIFLNLDHGKSVNLLKKAVLAGYDMVHFDGSKLPLGENIKISRKVLEFAKLKGVVVEGEVGRFSTDSSKIYEGIFEIKEENLTSLDQALKYIKTVKIDLLAINVGTFHGIDSQVVSPNIRMDRLRDIVSKVAVPFVLHGGSGTPQSDIRQAISFGIVKINVNTEIRQTFSESLRKILKENPDQIIPYKYLPSAINAVKEAVKRYIKLFGSENKI